MRKIFTLGYLAGRFVLSPIIDRLTVYNFDELIVAEIRKNNEGVLRELYKAHYPMIRSLVLSNSGTEPEAKDVYQEAIIAFYESVQRQNFVLTCKIKTYLYAICRRLWLKRLSEKKRYHGKIEEVETFLGVEEELGELERREKEFAAMKTSLEALGEPCSTIIRDFYIGDMSMESISQKYGYTNADNAKNQKYKCLQRLKKLFFAGYNG
jgi:RNA polymerase sigma factor (sigma-70 family)